MPYSTRYVIDQLARGKRVPPGGPEPELFRAIQALSPMDIEQALSRGASAAARDGRGLPAIHQLLDHPRLKLIHPEKATACARALLRHGRVGLERHPRTQLTALAAASVMADSPGALGWYRLWERAGDWRQTGPDGKSAMDHWRERASEDLLSRLPAPARPRSVGP